MLQLLSALYLTSPLNHCHAPFILRWDGRQIFPDYFARLLDWIWTEEVASALQFSLQFHRNYFWKNDWKKLSDYRKLAPFCWLWKTDSDCNFYSDFVQLNWDNPNWSRSPETSKDHKYLKRTKCKKGGKTKSF